MTTAVDSAERSAGDSPLDLGALAAAVSVAVTGPRGPAPAREDVERVLRMRVDGETYASIAAAVGVSEKRTASWCTAAQTADSRFRARGVKPRKVRKDAAARAPLDKMIGFRPRAGTRAVLERRAELEGRSLSDLVQTAVDAYVERKSAGVEVLVRRQLRRGLKPELRAVADGLARQELELARQGNNLNQLVRFTNKYRQLPVAITDELAATRAELEANRAELERLRSAVDELVGGEDR
ncbi:hypothetical protein [Gordonia sp. SND2]|uniref:hypothetical protein n=1 Tax=Gordonia sp. SND2 TaxID=3388659 RepID=UPI00398B9B5F